MNRGAYQGDRVHVVKALQEANTAESILCDETNAGFDSSKL